MSKRIWGAALACVVMSLVVAPAARADASAVNSGLPGSSCAPTREPNAVYTPPGAGVTTTGLGADAPAYYEIGAPTGTHTGRAPKAIMLVIHPGGWYVVGQEALARWARPIAKRWRSAGWQTVTVDYRACGYSIVDVLWFMQRLRALHPSAVICATGSSAGAHLAMLLATMRPD